MRLWSIHPGYLDSSGLVALWREALLAKKVLSKKKTKGYLYHPQLNRFKQQKNPVAAINAYLVEVYNESLKREYKFDRQKIGQTGAQFFIKVTDGQLHYEIDHLKKKLWKRNRRKYIEMKNIRTPKSHPLFRVVRGKVENWKKSRKVTLRKGK